MTAEGAGGGDEQVLLANLVSGSMPEGFARSVVTIRVGGSVSCSGQPWEDALLVVGRGALDVEASDGSRTRFPTGAVLAVAELPAGRLHNSGTEPVRLIAVRRSPSVESAPPRLPHHGRPRAGATDDFRG
jgi:hypothetical protein